MNGDHHGFSIFPYYHNTNNSNTVCIVHVPFKGSQTVKVEEKEVAFAHSVR